jgi:hypothetical protein
MRRNFLTKKTNSTNTLSCLKAIAIASALLILPLQSFAEKASHYGDINDEDGKYVAWNAKERDTVKTSSQSKPSNQKSIKMKTKKLSESALTHEYQTGYGDQNQD